MCALWISTGIVLRSVSNVTVATVLALPQPVWECTAGTYGQ